MPVFLHTGGDPEASQRYKCKTTEWDFQRVVFKFAALLEAVQRWKGKYPSMGAESNWDHVIYYVCLQTKVQMLMIIPCCLKHCCLCHLFDVLNPNHILTFVSFIFFWSTHIIVERVSSTLVASSHKYSDNKCLADIGTEETEPGLYNCKEAMQKGMGIYWDFTQVLHNEVF